MSCEPSINARAKYVVRHLRPDENKIDVGYVAHPPFVEADELRAIKGPLAISAAEVDAIFPVEKRYETEVVLKDLHLPYQINLYSDVEHGFAVRGDPDNRVVLYAKENAYSMVQGIPRRRGEVSWFGFPYGFELYVMIWSGHVFG